MSTLTNGDISDKRVTISRQRWVDNSTDGIVLGYISPNCSWPRYCVNPVSDNCITRRPCYDCWLTVDRRLTFNTIQSTSASQNVNSDSDPKTQEWTTTDGFSRLRVTQHRSFNYCQLFPVHFLVQLRSSWQDFNWQKASRGPSAISESLAQLWSAPRRITML